MEEGRFKACSFGGAFFIFTPAADATADAAACLTLGAFIAPPPAPSLPMHATDSRAVSHENQPVHCGPGTIVVVGRRLSWRILCSNSGLDDVAILFSIQNYVGRAINPDTANDKALRLQTHNLSTTEIGKKAWLFAKLQPGRTRKKFNAT